MDIQCCHSSQHFTWTASCNSQLREDEPHTTQPHVNTSCKGTEVLLQWELISPNPTQSIPGSPIRTEFWLCRYCAYSSPHNATLFLPKPRPPLHSSSVHSITLPHPQTPILNITLLSPSMTTYGRCSCNIAGEMITSLNALLSPQIAK